MRRLLILLALLLLVGAAPLVSAQGGEDEFALTVEVDSVFVHALPSLESDRIASAFEDQKLEAVGRNLDGTWFEVRRVGRLTNLGWLPAEFLDWDFHPEDLPLTDLVTGLQGPTPLEADPGFAVFLLSGANLRDLPLRTATQIGTVPLFNTVPVLARNADGSWLKVNYLGTEGWIVTFTGRPIPDLMAIPEAPGVPPPETVNIVIIPPEVQLAQIARLRAFTLPYRDLADGLAGFWLMVLRGEIMPCNPPEDVLAFQYTRADVRELPELDRYAPQLEEAVNYLNASLDSLQACGVIGINDVQNARAAAINARILFDATLERLDILEAEITR